MVVQYIDGKLLEKSAHHRAALTQLELGSRSEPLSNKVVLLGSTPQMACMKTLIVDSETPAADFIFYFDRLSCLLLEQYVL